MKTTIKTFAIALLAMTSNAFAIGGPNDSFHGAVHASGTYFATPPSDSWANVNAQNSVKAAFGEFDGETFVTLIAYDKQTDVVLDFKAAIGEGEIKMVVVNSQNEVVYTKTFTKSGSVETTLTLEVYEEYKVRFIGNQAVGAYTCTWTKQ